jgi:capsular polysaccharide biosynthesis protein
MNKDSLKEFNSEEEINLLEIFITLWKHKIPIICITLIAAVISGIYSLFILSPIYQADMNIVINMPSMYHTQYGNYKLPDTTNIQYITQITNNDILLNTMKDMGYDEDGMTLDALRDRITIIPAASKDQNSFNIKVAAENQAEAKKLA